MTRLDTRTHRAWTRDNPVLADGEIVAEKETRRLKIGDGVTRYNSLPFVGAGATPSVPSTPFTLTREAIESKLYDKAYSWELVPGSDVMATTVGVLPKIAQATSGDYYVGLVTIAPDAPQLPESSYWYVITDLTVPMSGVSNTEAYEFPPNITPGLKLAVYSPADGDPPPYAFPEGWTPGNATGSGPVLPYLGSRADDYYYTDQAGFYAGLIYYDGVSPTSQPEPFEGFYAGGWDLVAADTALSLTSVHDAAVVVPTGPGLFMARYHLPLPSAAPTTLPEGWTFRPYGLGQVAITDENAGGLIGDVAYVVSGYVMNAQGRIAVRGLNNIGTLARGTTINVKAGDAYVVEGHPDDGGYWWVTADGTAGANSLGEVGGTATQNYNHDGRYWPFIERFDLAAKKWLPRISLPELSIYDSTAPDWFGPNEVGLAGPFKIGPGQSIPAPAALGGATTRSIALYAGKPRNYGSTPLSRTRNTSGLDAPVSIPAGTYWIVTVSDTIAESAEALGDALGSRVLTAQYASEGGIAGVIDGKLYFGGGDGEGYVTQQEFFVYDPTNDSITRLTDSPSPGGSTPDYAAYGVVRGKIWWLVGYGDKAMSFDPVTSTWSMYDYVGDPLPSDPANAFPVSDQVQGFEIDGKLWFVYDGKAFVFDPVALTVTAKTAVTGSLGGPPFLVEGKIIEFASGYTSSGSEIQTRTYDSSSDTWVERNDVLNTANAYISEFVGVTYEDVPYALSANQQGYDYVPGVYGLTDVALDKPRPARLQDIKTPIDALSATLPKYQIRLAASEPGFGSQGWVPNNQVYPVPNKGSLSFETVVKVNAHEPITISVERSGTLGNGRLIFGGILGSALQGSVLIYNQDRSKFMFYGSPSGGEILASAGITLDEDTFTVDTSDLYTVRVNLMYLDL